MLPDPPRASMPLGVRRALRGASRGFLAAGVLSLAACGGPADGGSVDDGSVDGTTLTVFAAASLKRPLDAIAAGFEQEHDGVDVVLSYAGSSDLVAQLREGAEADVLLTADEATMERAVSAGLVEGEPTAFATNTMTIIVPTGNPGAVTTLTDLIGDGLDVVVCAPQVPCGAATSRILGSTGLHLRPASEESKVTDVLGKVASGEADAGIVYVTDAAGSDDVEAVAIPAEDNTATNYLVAVLADSSVPVQARRYVDAVLTDAATDGHLREVGFGAP